ncbi:MAG TPA: hypothetical protein VJJ98_12280 [Sedimentisphaerales bacterium]|nr:hypothetical protein [Sedimentisphaerales bacterium]
MMRAKWVVFGVLAGFSFLVAASRAMAVDPTAIDAVRSKAVLANQDLQVIDNFLADGIQELVGTRKFTDIARLRAVILSRQGTQKQYAEQFSASALKHLTSGLQAALTLPEELRTKVATNLLILIDGMADLKLLDLSAAMLRSDNAIVRYWAIHSLTNAGIVSKLNAGGAATLQAAGAIAKKLGGLIENSGPETLALMVEFAGGVKVSQAEELLLQIADLRIRQYAAWRVKYELLDGSILKALAEKMPSGSAMTSAVAYRFGQLYSCAIQRYVLGTDYLDDVQNQQLASVLVETEEKCTSKLLGAPRTAIRRAIERDDDAGLTTEHDRLLGTAATAGELAAKIKFVYGPDAAGRKSNGPFALPKPPTDESMK